MSIDRSLENSDELRDLILGYEPEIWGQLAQCMKLLPGASRGEQDKINSIILELGFIENELIYCAEHKEEKTR